MKIFKSLKMQLMLSLLTVSLLLSIILALVSSNSIEKKMIDILGSQTATSAHLLANLIEAQYADEIANIQETKKYDSSYMEISELLKKQRDENNFQYVYTLYKEGDKILYGIDADYVVGSQQEDSFVEIGQDYIADSNETTVKMIQETLNSKDFGYNHEITHDEYGDYLTATAPILDKNGNVIALLNIDNKIDNITTAKKQLTRTLNILNSVTVSIIMVFVLLLFNMVSTKYKRARLSIERMGTGDLTEKINFQETNEIKQIYDSIDNTKNQIKTIVHNSRQLITENTKNVSSINNNMHDFKEHFGEITKRLETANVAISKTNSATQNGMALAEELAAQINEIDNASSNLKETSDIIISSNKEGKETISNLGQIIEVNKEKIEEDIIGKINQIAKQMDEILPVVRSINDITNRVKMLSLNATIEAAHAGDAGRGFGVVASEIKKLAEKTEETARKIIGSVEEINTSIKTTELNSKEIKQSLMSQNKEVETAINTFNIIKEQTEQFAQNIHVLNVQISQVNSAKTSLIDSLENINDKMQSLEDNASKIAKTLSEDTEKVTEITQNITIITKDLNKIDQSMSVFKTE